MARAAKRAETSQSLACPHCGEPLPEGWRTDDVTGVSDDNQDEDNEGDNADGADQDVADYDNRRITRLNNLAKSLAAATERAKR